MGLNKVIIQGRIGADLELKRTPSEISVTSFNVAVDRKGTKEKITDWISVVAWRTTAEFICKYFKKGSEIIIVGELQTRTWTDSNNNKRTAAEVVASEVCFCGSKNENEGTNIPTNANAPTEQNKGSLGYIPSAFTSSANQPKFEKIPNDQDLPF